MIPSEATTLPNLFALQVEVSSNLITIIEILDAGFSWIATGTLDPSQHDAFKAFVVFLVGRKAGVKTVDTALLADLNSRPIDYSLSLARDILWQRLGEPR